MATNESSPLLPRGPQSTHKSVAWTKETPTSPTLRRRPGRRNGSPQKTSKKKQQHQQHDDKSNSDSDSDSDSDNDSDSDGQEAFADDAATRAAYGGAAVHAHHLHGRRAQQAISTPTPLSYASDSSASTSLGLARRKPKWAGFRSKVATLATTMEKASVADVLVPRKKPRRNRLRSSSDVDQRRFMMTTTTSKQEPPTDLPAMARVAAYCTSDQISVFKLLKWLDRGGRDETKAGVGPGGRRVPPLLPLRGWKNKMYMGVVHASYQPREQSNDDDDAEDDEHHDVARLLRRKDAFYFATGCCVFWGLTREEEATHIQALAAFSTGRVAEIEAEDMEFSYGDASRIANDAIFLSSANVEEKLAISFAMSQSAKLDVFEERVEDRIRNTKHIPFNLATTGSIQYSQTDISKLIGQLFIELADVNLHSDILDEPEFLWEDDEYEPLYKKMLKYLDVNNRVKILNKRLDILRELVEVLNQELTQQHGTKLEWIIIWLLVVEVIISLGWNILVKDLLGFFNRK